MKNKKIPLIQRRREYKQCILLIVTYGVEIWNLNKLRNIQFAVVAREPKTLQNVEPQFNNWIWTWWRRAKPPTHPGSFTTTQYGDYFFPEYFYVESTLLFCQAQWHWILLTCSQSTAINPFTGCSLKVFTKIDYTLKLRWYLRMIQSKTVKCIRFLEVSIFSNQMIYFLTFMNQAYK